MVLYWSFIVWRRLHKPIWFITVQPRSSRMACTRLWRPDHARWIGSVQSSHERVLNYCSLIICRQMRRLGEQTNQLASVKTAWIYWPTISERQANHNLPLAICAKLGESSCKVNITWKMKQVPIRQRYRTYFDMALPPLFTVSVARSAQGKPNIPFPFLPFLTHSQTRFTESWKST